MKGFTLFLFITGISVISVSCSSNFGLLAEQEESKVSKLEKSSKKQDLNSRYISKAETHYSNAKKLLENGDAEPAYREFLNAAASYRLALSLSEIEEKEYKIQDLNSSIEETQKEIKAYRKVLNQ